MQFLFLGAHLDILRVTNQTALENALVRLDGHLDRRERHDRREQQQHLGVCEEATNRQTVTYRDVPRQNAPRKANPLMLSRYPSLGSEGGSFGPLTPHASPISVRAGLFLSPRLFFKASFHPS